MPSTIKSSGLYSPHPGLWMVQKWKNELPAKTGRSLDQWIALVKKSGPPTEKDRREWLKNEHKLGTNSAWWIAERAEGKGTEEDSPEAYFEAAEQWDTMFSGPRAVLRPVYHQLLKLALSLGKDVKACPGKTIVPLGGYAKKDRIMRRIEVKSKADIDDDLKRWLRKAWERDA